MNPFTTRLNAATLFFYFIITSTSHLPLFPSILITNRAQRITTTVRLEQPREPCERPGCQGRVIFGTQAMSIRQAELCAGWQINCEPYADGLIRLSCSYKRLSRSNFILWFWLSHPTASRQTSPPALTLSSSSRTVLSLPRTRLPLSPYSLFAPMSLAP